MKVIRNQTRRVTFEYLAVILVLLLAAYLRLNHLDWTEFKLDEAHLSQLAYDMARHGQIPLAGIGSSVGIVNPPLAAWLLAIPYALSSSPIVATAFIALLNILAVALCYGLGRKLFAPFGGRTWVAAWIAALLFATAPWAVIYSRTVWAQDMLPPLVMLYAWFGYRAFVEHKAWSLIGHVLSLAALIQIHYSALWLIPVSAAWFIAFVHRVRLAPMLVSIVLAAAAFAPFVAADAQRDWPSISRLLDMARQPATMDISALHLAWITSVGQEVHALAGPQEFQNFLASVPDFDLLWILEGVLILTGLALALVDIFGAIRNRAWSDRSAGAWMLATWLVLPIAIQISHRTPLYPHYFIILYPAQFLLVGWFVARLARRLMWVAAGFAIVIAMAQTYQTVALQQFVAARPTPGAAGVPIGYYEQIIHQAQEALRENQATEILVNTRGVNPATDEYPAIFDFLLNDVPHRFVDMGQTSQIYPAVSNVQVDYDPAGPAANSAAARDFIAQIDLRPGEQPARVYHSDGYTNVPCAVAATPARWSNGVTLLSTQNEPLVAGQPARIRLCLRLDRAFAAEEYHWTVQMFDQNKQRRAQVDDSGYPTRYWRAGDILEQELTLNVSTDVPTGDYVLRIGQYTWPQVQPVLVIDAAGNPQSDAVEIPVHVDRR